MTIAAAGVGGSALGISLEPDAMERARAFRDILGMSGEKCQFKTMSIYDLPHAELPQFDQIILFEVLEHLYHDHWAIDYCSKLLKDDGWLHITVPNRDNHRHFEGVFRRENGQHLRHGYDFQSLESLLRESGLEPIDREGVGGLGTIWGFLAVAKVRQLPGILGQGLSVLVFFLAWPFVKLLDLIPSQPWSLYVLAAKRNQKPPLKA